MGESGWPLVSQEMILRIDTWNQNLPDHGCLTPGLLVLLASALVTPDQVLFSCGATESQKVKSKLRGLTQPKLT